MKLRLFVNTWLLTWLLLLLTMSAYAAPRQMMHGHVSAVVASLKSAGDFPGTNRLNLAIGLPLRNQAALSNLLQQIYDPVSPNYHHYLTPAQFTERFGPAEQDYQAVIAFANANGLRVTAAHPNRMLVDVSGSVANIQKAMHVTLRVYQHPYEARKFYAPDVEPSLDLSVPVLSIGGLDNYSLPRPRLVAKPLVNGQSVAPNAGSGPSGSYMGNDFRAAYAPGVTLTGSAQIVGLLQFDGYTASDISYYESQAGLPSVTLSNVLIDGASGNPSGSGGEVEVSLDIEMAISMAPGLSKVMVYMAPNPSPWEDLLNRMATDNLAKQLSCSWYQPGGAAKPTCDQIFQQMAAQGQSFFTASGDSDAYTGLIPFPGDTPYITQVGGTTLTTSGPGGAWVSETVWNWGNGVGSGGGISTQYPIPSWQTNVNMTANQGSTTKRNMPDVALTADNVYVRADGADHNVGGTSCAAPLWAGFTALINQQAAVTGKPPIGFVNPAIYAIGAATNYTSVFHDITTGNNESPSSPAKFSAVGGYDLCTGWGTPAGQRLINALAPLVMVTLPPSATEGDGLLAGAGQIQLPTVQTSDVVIGLTSSDPAQVTVPASVTVFAGQSNTVFDLAILDDGVLDGTQTATITASVPGSGTGSASMTIFDKETAALQVSLPVTVTKGQGTVQGSVQVSAAVAANVTVGLSSSSTNLIQVPASVIIPSGQTSAIFTVTILTDGQINGGQTVNITAHVQNWTDGVAAVTVQDNVNLTITLPATAWENAGVLVNAGSVSMAGISVANEVISLTSSKPAVLTVPSAVTILAGSTSNTFNITLINNGIAQSNQTVTVTASASAFTNGATSILVLNPGLPPIPSNPQPGNLATNVLANTNLMWNNGLLSSNQLVLNGGFETGTFTNWFKTNSTTAGDWVINNGTYVPPGSDGTSQPFAGNYSALSEQTGPGTHVLYQDITIPSGASSATMTWVDRIHNHGSQFTTTSQYFHAEIRGTNNTVLQVAFTTKPGDPLITNWVARSFDLSSYIGQKIRVAFVESDSLGFFNVGLDNVSVVVNAAVTNASGIITSDVYFGTNPTPGLAQFQGNTTNSSWTLPLLAPLTTYYWQIVAHGEGTTTGPVWQFTTAGADHFVWNTISSPQYVSQPFSTTVTAKDAFNTTVSNFTGRVGLSGWSGSSGLGQLVTFDDLSGSGLPVPIGYGGLTWSNFSYLIGADYPNSGYSAGTVSPPNAAYNPYGTPASIISTGLVNLVSAFLTAAWNDNLQVQVKGYSGATLVYSNSYTLSATAPTLINFNYLGVNKVDFISSGGTPHPGYSGGGTHFVMDNVVIGGSAASPVSITPTNSGNFINGTWSGNVTVLQPATNVALEADDGSKHTGSSNPFNVVLTNDISVSIVDSPDPVSVGANLTYTLTVTNTGPLDATGVVVTNILPASVTFVSAASSQGTCAQNGGVVACNLGVVPGATNATVNIVVVPTIAGITLTNTATVSRAEADNYLGNNTATAVTTVTTPAISIADASVIEGNVGTTNMFFAVTLTTPSAQTITVHYATSDGTAVAGSDYIATNGTVTFAPGITGATIAVAVIGDTLVESNETFLVNLSNPVNGVLGRAQGVGTIINDDGFPGNVDHFVWSAIASPQFVGESFNVTITALDVSNNTATNFNGTVAFSGTNASINPTVSDNFTNGTWSGNVAVLNRATHAVLVADDGNGHTGLSNPFDVAPANMPPVILAQPTNQTVIVDGTAMFIVVADGTPPLGYQWSFNGTNIVGATNTTLTLTNVQLSQAGNYAVLVTNAYGSVLSSNAVLTVNPPGSCTPPPSGLVSWWPGEGNASDIVGTNNGTLVNGAGFTTGEVGQAFSSDGVSSYVSIPDSPSLDAFVSSITIETWIKLNQLTADSNWEGIVTKGNSSWRLHATAGANTVYFAATGVSPTEDIYGSRNVHDGQWHHVAAVYDGTSMFLYVDGTLDVSQPATGSISQNNSPVCIGANAIPGVGLEPGYFFNGLIDEVSIYNRALTASEIQAIYAAGSGGKCYVPTPPAITTQPANQTVYAGFTADFSVTASGTPPLSYQWSFGGTNIVGATNTTLTLTNVQFDQAGNYAVTVTNAFGSVLSSNAVLTVNPPGSCTPPPSGLVSWWPAEGNANDVAGTNNGTLVNGAGFATGKVGQAFSFDGVSSYVSIPDSPSLDTCVSSITIETWIKLNQLTPYWNWEGIVTKGNSSWRLQVTAGAKTVTFSATGVSPQADLYGSRSVYDGQWHHVAGVYDGTNIFLYVDGTLDVSQPATGSISQNSYPVCIGENAGAPGKFLKGMVDEASIYNRALTASEIQTIYAAGSGGKCPLTSPTIISPPTNQTVTVGGTATFNVTASGAQPLSYRWNFNGTNIVGATNTTLTLTNIQVSQAGNYSVRVTNLFGSILSSNAVLTITLDHFTWSPIPSPRFVNTPFAVTIQARDLTNGLFTNYTGTAVLGTTNGVAVTPPVSGNFIQGVWTGTVVISQTASSLVLQADDGLGHFGLANPINVISLPQLGMLRSGNIALYMWPVGYSGFVLETSSSLSPATWVVVPYAPIQLGDQYLLPLDMTGTNGFYRLWFPGP